MSDFYNTLQHLTARFEIKKMIRLISVLILLLTLQLTGYGQEATRPMTQRDFNSLDWIVGEWQRSDVRPGFTARESWEKVSDTLYKGIGVSMKGTDTTFVEHLRIEFKSDKIFYVADVEENETPTYFELIQLTDKCFVSQNLKHDFPKVIDYRLDVNELIVVISDAGTKKMGFVFRKN